MDVLMIMIVIYGICFLIVYCYDQTKQANEAAETAKWINPSTLNPLEYEGFFIKYFAGYDVQEAAREAAKNRELPQTKEIVKELTQAIGEKPVYTMIWWGLLAEQGKIPANYYIFTPYTNENDQSLLKNIYDVKDNEYNMVRIKFLKWYDKKLRENGMSYELMYALPEEEERWGMKYKKENVKPVSEIDGDMKGKGEQIKIFWEPIMRQIIRDYC